VQVVAALMRRAGATWQYREDAAGLVTLQQVLPETPSRLPG
jgi:hypothetical protein